MSGVDAVAEGINAHLEAENERLNQELASMRALLARPVAVTVSDPSANTLNRIEQYLPQLTHIATNLSYAASAVHALQPALERIAKALETEKP